MVTRPLIKADRSSHRRRRTPGSFASVMATPCTFCLIFVASLYLLAFASAQTPIRIGRTVSNCGLFQKESQYIQDGLDFWLADVNARGGLLISDGTRRPVELITYSDGSDDAVVEILYDWLINQDKVEFLIGPMSTVLTIAAVRKANETGTPIFFGGASERSLYGSGYKHSFGTLIQIGKRLAPCVQLLGQLGAKTMETIYTNDSFQIVSANALNNFAKANNITVSKNFSYAISATDFTGPINEWKARPASQRPDVVAFAAVSLNALPFIDQLRDTKKGKFDPKAVIFTNGGAYFSVQAERLWEDENILLGDQWATSLNYTDEHYGTLANFVASFKQRKGRDVTYLDASAFTCGYVLEKALEVAPSQTPQDVIAAVRDLDIESLWGRLQFLPTGELNFTGICDQIQDGNLEVIAPTELRTATVIYPGLPNRPPAPALSKKERLGLILGLTLGGGLLLTLGVVLVIYLVNARYHLIFIPKDNAGDDGAEWGS